MTCLNLVPTFRLLDFHIGWDEGQDAHDLPKNLEGITDADGLRLALLDDAGVNTADIDPYVPPPRLAPGCGPCAWYLLTPVPPAPRLLGWDSCECRWSSVWPEWCAPGALVEPVAIAAWRRRVAVSDRGARTIFVWSRNGRRLAAEIRLDALDENCADADCTCDERAVARDPRGARFDWEERARGGRPGPLAFNVSGELLVGVERGGRWMVFRFGLVGERRGRLPELPAGRLERLAASRDGAVWAFIAHDDDALEIWRLARGANEFESANLDALKQAFPRTNLTAATRAGFCLEQRDAGQMPRICCFSWYGRPLCDGEVEVPAREKFEKFGQLLTRAVDSGVPRCRWHRIRLDADVPKGTGIEVAVSTSDVADPAAQGVKETTGDWKDFPEGVPHPSDWQKSPTGSLDFLVSGQPPGRYLFVRVRLTGDGNATPRVRRVRLDFPRATSLDLLPAVYRENPDAEDFTERFLSLFDSTVADIDRGIERYAALLDPEGVPEEMLPWLGSFLDVAFDRSWSAGQRRAILRAVPELYRRRGTIEGLSAAIRLVFGFDPVIEELAAGRMWGALASKTAKKKKDAKGGCKEKELSEVERQCERSLGARVGEVRLFGRASARFRIGGSSLGRAPLLSFGNPDNDPLNESAYRFRVLAPPQAIDSALWRERLRQLVESQKPAHTVATVRVGGGGFVLGTWSSVGVDTSLTPTPAPVLGREGNVRLRRMSVLWPGRTGRREGVAVGETAVVGMQIVME